MDAMNDVKMLQLGQFPVLDVNTSVVVSQSAAILRYVGILEELYPSDEVDALEIDFYLVLLLEDLLKALVLTVCRRRSKISVERN
jgi:glutathione S-transferase